MKISESYLTITKASIVPIHGQNINEAWPNPLAHCSLIVPLFGDQNRVGMGQRKSGFSCGK
jgi:hypothetical protein